MAYDQTVKLSSLRFDQVGEKEFRLPVGEDEQYLVHDGIRHMTYVHYPKGTDPLQAALKEVETHTSWDTQQSDRNRKLLIINVVLVNLMIASFLVRQILKASPAPSAA